MLTLDSFESLMNETKEVTLTVDSGDEAAEIFILNNKYNRIASKTGQINEFKLEPGVYIVKIRAGSDSQEKSVVLHDNQKVTFNPIEFSTPVPLEGTSKTHEYHAVNAITQSHKVHVKIGQGSQIYVFVRDLILNISSDDKESLKHTPAKGLTLYNGQGQLLIDLELFSDEEIKENPWAACNMELNPGNYRLCLETADGDICEQTIIASPGWQTQVFLSQRNYDLKKKDLRADLSNASIFMSEIGQGIKTFKTNNKNAGEPDLRLAELARQALINDRLRLTENVVQQALNEKFSNPMLGIYGAHLMLRNKEYDRNLLTVIIENLRNLLKEPHPDVEAIALKSKIGSNYIFNLPPMLRNSWAYVLEASVQQPDLVSENSVAAQIAGNLWSEGMWLVWGHSSKQTDNDQILIEQLKKFSQLEASFVDTSNLPPDQLIATKNVMPFDAANADILSMPQPVQAEIQLKTAKRELNDEQILRMVQALGVPRARLDAMLRNIDAALPASKSLTRGVNEKWKNAKQEINPSSFQVQGSKAAQIIVACALPFLYTSATIYHMFKFLFKKNKKPVKNAKSDAFVKKQTHKNYVSASKKNHEQELKSS